MSETEVKKHKGQRGKGVKPALVYRSLRLPAEVLAFYNEYPNPSSMMRAVLEEFVRAEKYRLTKEYPHGSDT